MASRAGPGGGETRPAACNNQRAVEQWLRFALAQQGRTAPHPDPASLQMAATRSAYRLTLRHLDGLPLFASYDSCFEVRLGVSLWDAAAGFVFGNTAHSAPVQYDMQGSKGKRGFHLNLDFSLYLHTHAALANHSASHSSSDSCSTPSSTRSSSRLAAVVEVVLVERGEDGVMLNEYSAGWSMVPLSVGPDGCSSPHPHPAGPEIVAPGSPNKAPLGSLASTGPAGPGNSHRRLSLGSCLGCGTAPHSPVPANTLPSPPHSGAMAARLSAGGSTSVPVLVGSPRWLLLHLASPPGHCPVPPQLLADGAECRLHFQFEPCPEAEVWAPLVPDIYLLSSRDVVPGVRRCRGAAAAAAKGPSASSAAPVPTLAFLNIASQLEPAQLCAMHAVVLSGLRLHLPDGFVEVARQHAAATWRQAHAGCGATAGSLGAGGARRLLSLHDLQQRLRLLVSVHNGRRFVGPPAVCQATALEPVHGHRGEHELVLDQPAPLAWLPADKHVMIVLELLLHTDPPPSDGRGDQAGTGASPSEFGGAPGTTVLGWAAISPFAWQAGSLAPAVVIGQHQASLRSGPGRWLRPSPALDWRRLLERTNRLSPAAPTISFYLAEAPGQAIWPPPPAPVPLQTAPPPARSPACGVERQAQLSSAASEAETLVSVGVAPALQKGPFAAPATLDLAAVAGGKPIAAPATVQAWRISANYDAAASSTGKRQQAERREHHPLLSLSSICTQTRPADPSSSSCSDAEALYTGSPRKSKGSPATQHGVSRSPAEMSSSEAAVAALPAEGLIPRHISLAAELDDPLASTEATLQFLAFETEPGQGGGCGCSSGSSQGAQQVLPSQLHFTFHSLAGPCVTAPLRLELTGGQRSAGPGGQHLFALAADESGDSGGTANDASAAAPVHRLQLLDAAGLQQLASAEGLPPAAAASLVRQHRLRAARWLAEGRLQVDVWDSNSLLQVGTLSLPLHGLLRQGQPSTELLLRVPVGDPNRAITRLDPSGSRAQLCCSPIQGSLIVRLACTGMQLDLQAEGTSQQPLTCHSWSISHLKQAGRQGSGDAPAVVFARPALEEGGQLALELARQEGVPEGTPLDRLGQEVVGRAAARVQRLLHYRSLPSTSCRCQVADAANGPTAGGVDGSQAGPPAAGCGESGLLVERRLLNQVEAAREKCKRQAMLARLQADLPFCQALCIAPGETVGFEFEFVNGSWTAGCFEVDLPQGSSGSSAGVALSLVTGDSEWRVLEQASSLAGLTCIRDSHNDSANQPRAVYSPRFQLAAHERCVLRLKLSCSLTGGQVAASSANKLSWINVAIRRALGSTAQPAAGARERAAGIAARICAGVQQLAAPAVHRTLRLYCPASSPGMGSQNTATHAVDLAQLPGSEHLLAQGLHTAFVCSSPAASAVLEGNSLQLSSAAAEAGSTQRFLMAAYSRSRCGGSSDRSSGSSSDFSGALGSPTEVWEVFVHSLPCARLAASVGSTSTASCLIDGPEAAGSSASTSTLGLACSWRGCGASQLAVSLSGPSTSASAAGRSSRLELSYEPSAVRQQELLLSVVASRGSQRSEVAAWGGCEVAQLAARGQRAQQVELLLVQLDSNSTSFSRTFEVEVPVGQGVSKKVRYSSPHPHPRRFAVRSLHPGLLRPANKWQRAEGGILLQPGEEASIRLEFGGAAVTGNAGSSGGQSCEAMAVLESAVASGDGSWRVEEIFRVLLKEA